ncbi:MAG: hypothetical protein R3D28_19585 [Geminicoccaceae bacterium]
MVHKGQETLDHEVELGIDDRHRLSVAEAARFCQKMPRGTLDFLEEPSRDETPEAYEALRRMTDILCDRRRARLEMAVPAWTSSSIPSGRSHT